MPRSRSRSLLSIAWASTFWFSRKAPACLSSASTSVVLPWSTWAMIAMLRMLIYGPLRDCVPCRDRGSAARHAAARQLRGAGSIFRAHLPARPLPASRHDLGNCPERQMRAWPRGNAATCELSHVRSRQQGTRKGPSASRSPCEGGQELSGKLMVPPGRSADEVLNGGASFVEFEPADGERMFIAKSALRSVKPTNVPAAPDLWAGPTEAGNFDPFAVLGVKPGPRARRCASLRQAGKDLSSRSLCRGRASAGGARLPGGDGAPDQCRPPGARERAAKAGRQAGGGVHPQRPRVSGNSAHALLT